MQLSGEPLPKLCDGRSASSSALSAQEGASKGDQTTAGNSIEVQEHAASTSTATARPTEQKAARADPAASPTSDAASQSREVSGKTGSSDIAEDSDAPSSPCHSSAGSLQPDKGCAEPKRSQAPHSRDGSLSCATAGDLSPSDTSTHGSKSDIRPSHASHREQDMLPDEASSAVDEPARGLSGRGSGPQPKTARDGLHAQGEQRMGSKASTAEGGAAHQDAPASSSTSSQTRQTHNAEGDASEPLLQEPLPQDSEECPRLDSANGSSGSASDIRQEHECGLKRRVRDPGQFQMTRQSHQQGQHAGEGIRQQHRQTDVTLDLAIAVSMVVGLTAVLVCGLFMLASTYMSANM